MTLISTHTPTEEKDGVAKEEIYISLEKVCDAVPNYNRKTILAHFNTKVGEKKSYLYPAFTMKQLIMEKTKGKFCTGKRFSCSGNMVSTLEHSPGHLEINWQQNM